MYQNMYQNTTTRLTVEVQDVVAGVGQSPASASASRTAAQRAAGLLELRRVEAEKLTSVRSQDDTTGSNTTKTREAGRSTSALVLQRKARRKRCDPSCAR